MESKKGRILIEYCGGWGYWSRANDIQEAVENQFPSTFIIIPFLISNLEIFSTFIILIIGRNSFNIWF